jgi:hypothetical protein
MLPQLRSIVAPKVLLSREDLIPIHEVKHLIRFEDVLSSAEELCKLQGLIAAIIRQYYGC